jgi:hypothetical protein
MSYNKSAHWNSPIRCLRNVLLSARGFNRQGYKNYKRNKMEIIYVCHSSEVF